MITLVNFLYTILVIYLSAYSIFWIVSTVLGLFYRPPFTVANSENPELLLLLPAYKPSPIFTEVLARVTKAIGERNIKVLVLLQEADPKYRVEAESHGFMVEEKVFSMLPGNSYHHALKYLTARITDYNKAGFLPEFVMLLDKDNLIDEDFFSNISEDLYNRYDVFQGRRLALNTDQSTSFFDAVSEGLNDLMFRAAGCKAGDTLEISGSSALIRTSLFCKAINQLNPKAPGFDKNFMVNILTSEKSNSMIFLPDCKVREEKTNSIEAHNPQRLRWFGEQYFNAVFSAPVLFNSWLHKGRWSALWYLVVLCRPPRSVQLLLLPLLVLGELIMLLFTSSLSYTLPLIVISTVFVLLSSWLTLRHLGLQSKAFQFALRLPTLAVHNIINALKSVKAENRGKFIHTEHKL